MPRRAALAQVLGVSPWRRGGRPVPLGTDAGRAATAARCSRTTSGERAPEERPAGRPAIIYILSAWRARVLACSARLHASRLCASGAPARTFTWRASRASHLAHSVRTDATHCARPDALVVSDLCTRLGDSEPNHRLSAVELGERARPPARFPS